MSDDYMDEVRPYCYNCKHTDRMCSSEMSAQGYGCAVKNIEYRKLKGKDCPTFEAVPSGITFRPSLSDEIRQRELQSYRAAEDEEDHGGRNDVD